MSESHLAARIGIAASIAVHLALLIAGLGYAGFLLVPSGPEQSIAVDLVTPQEVADLVKPPEPQAAPPSPEKDSEPPAAAPSPQPSAQPSAPEVARAEQRLQQVTAPQPEADTPPAQPPAAFKPPEPDISVRYPMNLSMIGRAPGDFDAKASNAARIDGTAIAAFRAQLKSCSTLPVEITPDDKVVIVIRAQFLPDGRLATAPILIEASASAKGPLLMQAAIAALQACQPYASLPADKYQEWKLLDLTFTPQDFQRG